MNMRKKRGFILLMIFTATLSVLSAGEDWQSDAARAERYYKTGDFDAAWLFFERAMARGADDGLVIFHAAESFRQQGLADNPVFGADLYTLAHHLMQEQYPDSPALASAAAQGTPGAVVNRRFLKQLYGAVGGRPPKLESPVSDGLGSVSGFFLHRIAVLGEFLSILRSEGLKDGMSWAREHAWNLVFSWLVANALTGIILPVVMAVTVAREGRKSYVSSYAFLFHWGFLGIHRFYLGRHISGVIWLLTGGLLGLGLFFDIFLTGAYTRFWNEDHKDLRPALRYAGSRRAESPDRSPARPSGRISKPREKRKSRIGKKPLFARKAKKEKLREARPVKVPKTPDRTTKEDRKAKDVQAKGIIPSLADTYAEHLDEKDLDFDDLPEISFDDTGEDSQPGDFKETAASSEKLEEFSEDGFDIKAFE
jgi:TM2 domain-containing membrane protein YozV